MSGMIWSPKRTIEQIAEQTEKYGRKVGPPKGTKITEIRTGDAHALWCELPGADVATCPVIIHFHGGGYVCGSCYSVQGSILPVFLNFPCIVVIVDFRLCPKFTPNDAVDDGFAIYRHVLTEMKIDARRLVLMGESAGGALSVRVAQAVRDSDLPAPACVVSWSPWLDVTRSYIGHPHQDVVTPENMERIRACIPQHLHRECSPLFSDVTGLPPYFLSGGSYELMADEIAQFAEKCRAAGVDLTYELVPGLSHTFQLHTVCPEGRNSQQATFEFIRKWTSARPASTAEEKPAPASAPAPTDATN